MNFYLLGQRIEDISEFHTYLQHTLFPVAESNQDDVYGYETDLCKKEKFHMLVVRNTTAYEKYTAFLKERHAEDFLETVQPILVSNHITHPIEAWASFLEKLANENYLVFSDAPQRDSPFEKIREGENALVLWNSDEQEKLKYFQDIWTEKSCFFIVKSKYLGLFKQLTAAQSLFYKDIQNFFECITYMGIIADEGNTVIMLASFADIHYAEKNLLKNT